MKARSLLHERRVIAEEAFVELVVWQVPSPVLADFWNDVDHWRS
jgi:hypothetical protein